MSTSAGNLRNRCSSFYCIDSALSWMFGVVFLISGIEQWRNPYFFLGSVYKYDLVGENIGKFVAMVLPILELGLAACLIVRIWADAAHLIAFVLFACFAGVQTLAFLRDLDISCGCFGGLHEMRIGVASLVSVGTLFVLSAIRNGIHWRSVVQA